MTDDIHAPRFSRVGDLVAIHYPTGFTPGRTHLDALAQALRIKRWHLANARVVDAWDAAKRAPVVSTDRPRADVAADLLALALRVLA